MIRRRCWDAQLSRTVQVKKSEKYRTRTSIPGLVGASLMLDQLECGVEKGGPSNESVENAAAC